jgi:hypothetical protein
VYTVIFYLDEFELTLGPFDTSDAAERAVRRLVHLYPILADCWEIGS